MALQEGTMQLLWQARTASLETLQNSLTQEKPGSSSLPGKRCWSRKVLCYSYRLFQGSVFFLKKKTSETSKTDLCETGIWKTPLLEHLYTSVSTAQPQGVRWFSYCLPKGALCWNCWYSAPIQSKNPHQGSSGRLLKMQMCKNSRPASPPPGKCSKPAALAGLAGNAKEGPTPPPCRTAHTEPQSAWLSALNFPNNGPGALPAPSQPPHTPSGSRNPSFFPLPHLRRHFLNITPRSHVHVEKNWPPWWNCDSLQIWFKKKFHFVQFL